MKNKIKIYRKNNYSALFSFTFVVRTYQIMIGWLTTFPVFHFSAQGGSGFGSFVSLAASQYAISNASIIFARPKLK